ncbi:ATP-dependent RNA helicase [Candidatus Saccharibacteria bacterium]|nr:ATP-dependent RNA helicase [Candidatus Saccharibacteria bacterium]
MSADSFEHLQELPVYDRREDILASVDANQVTIVTAETGAGKSTQVPQFLAEHGYNKIIVTQPRILAARNLSARVREEYSWRMGRDCTDLVGYRTAHERDDHPDNVIMYCTDGLQLVRELTGSGTNNRPDQHQVLVLDEIHEWNENMEVLVAWAKKRCQEDPQFKVVLMSATIETQTLIEYFDAPPPISVAGRSFAVHKRQANDLLAEVFAQLDGSVGNMLVFLPGKAEIENVADALKSKAAARRVPVIPLHSQLEPAQQQLAFKHYPSGKIVLTTNVAQTSVTIDDIDIVIDSGLERRSEVRSGVEGLFIAQISQADCLQRAGRAGRTKEGQYILAQLGDMPCSPLAERPAYGVPEIMRKHIDRLVLRLANIGIDIESLEFYHSPSRSTIKLAKRTLVSLGALTTSGEVTDIGREMEQFPVSSGYARMLVEGGRYSQQVQATLAVIIAIQEVGGIVRGGTRYTGWRRLTRQTQSDLLAQYDVYRALDTIAQTEHEQLGIITKNVTKAEEVHERLHGDLGLGAVQPGPVGDETATQLLKCIVAGQLHQLWAVEPGGEAIHIGTKKRRELSNGTVVHHANLIAGTPFDLQVTTVKGLETLHLVNDVTAVDPEWLQELAPDVFKVQPGKVYFDSRYGTLAARRSVKFNGRTFAASSTPLLERSPRNEELFVEHYGIWLHEQLEKDRQTLQIVNQRRIPTVPVRQVQQRVRQIAAGAISLLDLNKKQRIELSKLAKVQTYLQGDDLARLTTVAYGHHPREHGRRKGWQSRHKRKFERRRGY